MCPTLIFNICHKVFTFINELEEKFNDNLFKQCMLSQGIDKRLSVLEMLLCTFVSVCIANKYIAD